MPRLPTLLALLLCLPAQALAGGSGAPGERWYLIELIAFERPGYPLTTTSLLHDDLPRFDGMGRAVALRTVETPAGLQPAMASGQSWQAYQHHPGRWLVEAHRRLARHPDYQVLLYESWLLPPRNGNRPVQLGWADSASASAPGDAGNTLLHRAQGLVRTRITRHLDVDVDFAWFPFARDSARGQAHGRIRQTRRIKLKQLHYFDHPAFGLLLQVSPLEKQGS